MSENQKRLHVQHYYSTNKNSVPEVNVEGVDNENALIDGEIAINHADEKLFIKKNGATDSNDVVTFSSDEKLDEKYAPKKDYVVNGTNENGIHVEMGDIMTLRPVIHMGEFEYNTNGGYDSANGIGILVEEDIESSGLIVESGYVKLIGESESCSSSTGGGSVELSSETVKLTTWNDPCEGDTFLNTLMFNKDGLNVEIDDLDGGVKNFSVNKDGLIFDGSRVVTEQILGEHEELVKVDENGIANKSELTIGSFEIKNDKPYNYTLEGHYEPWDWGRYTDEYATDCTFVAEYNHEGAKLYSDGFEEDYWAYEFVVTEAKIYVSYENEGVEDFKWISFNELVGNVLPIPVNLLDKLVFTDGVADVEEYIHIRVDAENDNIYDAKIIETAPFLLKSTSKALLNGSPVITVETLAKSDIVSNLNKKINEEANRATNAEEALTTDLNNEITRAKNVEAGLINRIESIENNSNPQSPIEVDSTLSTTSVNPVQNKVITNKINELVEKNEEIDSNFAELNEKIDSSKLILTTWSNLNSLKNENKLIPGTKYRITDYVATSITENTTCKTSCKFDIIVSAISENELDEVATTISKDGANEEIYKIWYSLTNDSERFAWADTTNGKGVIYRMIDKYNNDVPYDFRNILFRGRNVRIYTNGSLGTISINEGEYYNTLCSITSNSVEEGSVLGLFKNIKIDASLNDEGKQILNNNIIFTYSKKIISNIILNKGCYNNMLTNCKNVHFMQNCYNNYISAYGSYYSNEIVLGIGCHNNFFNGNAEKITMGSGCSHNLFGYSCGNMTMENNVVGNILGATDTYREKPTFGGTSFYDILLVEKEIEGSDIIDLMDTLNIDIIAGSSVKYCNFKHQSRCNIIGNGAQLITLGMRSHHNIIGEYSTRIQIGDVAYNNILFTNGYTKTINENGETKWVSPSSIISDTTLDPKVMYCQIGAKDIDGVSSSNLRIGKNSYKVLIPSGSENVTVGSDVWYVKSDKPLKNVEIKDSNAEINFISNNDKIENVTLECSVYENKLSDEPSYVDISVTSNNTHILSKNNSLSCGINTKINGDYAFAFGNSVSNGNYSFSSGLGTAYGKGSVSLGGFYSRNYQTIVINNVSYELSSDKKYTIATCEYTHKGETNHVNKYPCVGNGLNGCIGYITEITEKATSKDGSGVFKFYIPTTDLTNNKPTNDKFVITNGTHYVSNCSIGDASTTFGILNTAKGLASSTFGLGLQANNAYEFACGKYNLSSSDTVFSVGYGNDNKNRKNIFEVKTNGDIYFDCLDNKTLKKYIDDNLLTYITEDDDNSIVKVSGDLTVDGDINTLSDMNVQQNLNVQMDSTVNGKLTVDGVVTASAFYESSDERLKTFGDDIDVDLDKLAELRKSFFTFNSKPEKIELGVSAQEIQKLYPEIVNENEDGFLSVDYSKLSVIALKAIDKLNDKNKELEERLARIEKALNLQ